MKTDKNNEKPCIAPVDLYLCR